MRKLYLFRHGEISQKRAYIGHSDVELSKKGARQNLRIARFARQHKLPVYSSDLQRARVQNAISSYALREICFGRWEGKRWEEIDKNERQEYLRNTKEFSFPEGESFVEFSKRVMKEMRNLLERHDEVMVVTHAGVIQCVVSELFGIPYEETSKPAYGSGTMLERNEDGWTMREIRF